MSRITAPSTVVVLLFAVLVGAPSARAQAPPAPPLGLTATVSSTTVTLAWLPPTGDATGYVVEAGSAPALTDLGSASTNALQLTVGSVPQGNYFVRVRATNAGGTSGSSNEVLVSVGTPCQLPAAPANVVAAVTGSLLTLTWTGTSGSVRLEAGSAPERTDLFNGDIGAVTSVSGVVPDGYYFLRLRGRNTCGFGAPSPEVLVTIGVPEAPGALSASVIGSTLTLRWTAPPTPGVDGYLIAAGTAPGLSDLAAAPLGNQTTLVVPGVPAGTYYVRVQASAAGVAGAPSNELAITVGPPPPGTSMVSFTGLAGTNATPFTSHTELGYLVAPLSGPWTVLATYGRPSPSITLVNPDAASDLIGSVRVTAAGAPFRLASVDLYSSVTTIPYTLTGTLGGNPVFSATGIVPNTFGNFATVTNPFATALIDALVITVTNPASPQCPTCAGNPVGVDNIVLRP